jgi:hypothetical protein
VSECGTKDEWWRSEMQSGGGRGGYAFFPAFLPGLLKVFIIACISFNPATRREGVGVSMCGKVL